MIKGQEAICSIVILKKTIHIELYSESQIKPTIQEKSSHFQLVYELIKRNQNPIFRYGHLNILICKNVYWFLSVKLPVSFPIHRKYHTNQLKLV